MSSREAIQGLTERLSYAETIINRLIISLHLPIIPRTILIYRLRFTVLVRSHMQKLQNESDFFSLSTDQTDFVSADWKLFFD